MYKDPYENAVSGDGSWLRSNFHIHAGTGRDTCGAYEIDDVFSSYKETGYDLLTLSNHDILTDVSKLEEKYSLVLLNGFEYSQDPHMLCINVSSLFAGDNQSAVDECVRQGGFSILCHPNWHEEGHWSLKALDEMKRYAGIEIFNGLIFELTGSGLATDAWDHLLSGGKLVWGFGSDDFHRWYNLARSWNMIYSSDRDHKSVLDSISKGSFYVSTGLKMDEFIFQNNRISISASPKNMCRTDLEYIFIGKNGRILKKQNNNSGEYDFEGDETYVRVQVISSHGAMLWTQPVYDDTMLSKP
jgi:hypothetical protein